MKTGTSFVQSVLATHREALAEAGIGYPAASPQAVLDLLKLPRLPKEHRERWQALAAATDGDLLVSMEFLSFATERQVAAALEPFAGDRVEVVVSVRDQLGAIPAQWQTYCRNLGTEGWPDYLRSIEPTFLGRPRRTRAFKTFNRAQQIPTFVRRWEEAPGVSSVHVVTVPPSGSPPGVLWQRFAAAAGLPDIEVDLSIVESNPSLGYGSCDLLRRANEHLSVVRPKDYRRGVRKLARGALVVRRGEESKPVLDRGGVKLGLAINREVRSFLEERGYPVFGHLADIRLDADIDAVPDKAPAVDESETRAAALAARTWLAGRLGEDPGPAHGPLDELVRDTSLLLARANGWSGVGSPGPAAGVGVR
ncbi:hypothetical protein [Nocardioides sp. LHG3406-4]|uniref:hypothetical protein n=1 Tax=Nocardioides sp. LHG3406-4 TaxID=2804575 RepID=UPI003CE73B4F